MSRTLGTTNRSQTVKGEYLDPVQHIATMIRWSPHGRTVKAACGRQVHARGRVFDPEHPRACRECIEATS